MRVAAGSPLLLIKRLVMTVTMACNWKETHRST